MSLIKNIEEIEIGKTFILGKKVPWFKGKKGRIIEQQKEWIQHLENDRELLSLGLVNAENDIIKLTNERNKLREELKSLKDENRLLKLKVELKKI